MVADSSTVLGEQSRQRKLQSLGFVIGISLCVLLSLGIVVSGAGWFTGRQDRIELDCRVNPNAAPVSSLVRLPGIGPAKAAAIFEYRQSLASKGTENAAFEKPQDLQKVKGIGPKTVQKLVEFLKFD